MSIPYTWQNLTVRSIFQTVKSHKYENYKLFYLFNLLKKVLDYIYIVIRVGQMHG